MSKLHRNHNLVILGVLLLISCNRQTAPNPETFAVLQFGKNILDYRVTPNSATDKSGLMYSDQGAWFAYSFPDSLNNKAGFTGPFLMTQQNGVWSGAYLSYLQLQNHAWKAHKTTSYSSHLVQTYQSDSLSLTQKLVFLSGHTVFIQSSLKNISEKTLTVQYQWKNSSIMADSLSLSEEAGQVKIVSPKTRAIGYLKFPEPVNVDNDNNYTTRPTTLKLGAGETKEILITQSFIFPEYSWEAEKKRIEKADFNTVLYIRKTEKNKQLTSLIQQRKIPFKTDLYAKVLAKAHLTLQNNWRIPAGEIKYEGLFPSYHYKWFHGFWSWDSWKHAVGLSYFDLKLAKNQVRLMFDFQNEDGFVADCVFRDTTIEKHNYRDTKPPLAAWAVMEIIKKDPDTGFVKELYGKLKKYHYWWYAKRDHDQDGICEYGSTDGTLVAAKWESGMDNAIRFDNAEILKNSEGAYSMNQESIDLNAYLYAEKIFLADLASMIHLKQDENKYLAEAQELKLKIRQQFFHETDGWFYDTDIKGTQFIKGEGSEGWTALWANVASPQQAKAVKVKMMDPAKFYTHVPFQTMSADHPKFNPLKGYWRGPNWLDQAYFGVQGFRNYGYHKEANSATLKILNGCEGLLENGYSIRENYHPLTGKGLNAENFSWSAAHIIMLLTDN